MALAGNVYGRADVERLSFAVTAFGMIFCTPMNIFAVLLSAFFAK
jgi:hypothetical protein